MKKFLVLFLMLGLCMSVFSKEFTEAFNNADYTKCQEILDSTKPNEKTSNWQKFQYSNNFFKLNLKLNKITKDNVIQEAKRCVETYNLSKSNNVALLLIPVVEIQGTDLELKNKSLKEAKNIIEQNYDEVKSSILCGIVYRELKEYNKAIESFKISRNLQKNNLHITWMMYHLTCILGVEFTDAQKIEALSYVREVPGSISTPYRLNLLCENIKSNFFDPKYDEVVKPLLLVLNRSLYSNIAKSEEWKKAIVNLHLLMKSYNL